MLRIQHEPVYVADCSCRLDWTEGEFGVMTVYLLTALFSTSLWNSSLTVSLFHKALGSGVMLKLHLFGLLSVLPTVQNRTSVG